MAETTQIERGGVRGNRAIGASFTLFLLGMTIVGIVVRLEAKQKLDLASGQTLASRIGVVAATLFCLGGVACLYRLVKSSSTTAALTAVCLTVPGATWSWFALVTRAMPTAATTTFLVVMWSVLAVILLVAGFVHNDWFEAFTGLGALALATTALMARAWFDGPSDSFAVSLLASVAGMACLFGMLVELELNLATINRNLAKVTLDLRTSTQRSADLMHDLRGGLLSIEAASAIAPGQGSGLLTEEIARLRMLTKREDELPTRFDLIAPVKHLVNVRRSGGVEIDLRSPDSAVVIGSESQVLSIVQNLIENAERHGEGTISLHIEEDEHGLRVGVADEGPGLVGVDKQAIFRRGVTTSSAGLGVGLHVSRRLAKANDAELYYDADESGRSRFVLSFTALRTTQPAFAS